MVSRMLAAACAAVTVACGAGAVAVPAAHAASVECGSTQTRLIGSAPNSLFSSGGKTYKVNVGLYGKYDATVSSDFCGALKIIMKVTVPSGGVVTKGRVNLQTDAGDVITQWKNDAAGTTTTYDTGWVAGHCMNSGDGQLYKPGASSPSTFYTGYGTGSHCV
jgi:hypothetical protein